jgi:hypothetical protein
MGVSNFNLLGIQVTESGKTGLNQSFMYIHPLFPNQTSNAHILTDYNKPFIHSQVIPYFSTDNARVIYTKKITATNQAPF